MEVRTWLSFRIPRETLWWKYERNEKWALNSNKESNRSQEVDRKTQTNWKEWWIKDYSLKDPKEEKKKVT